MANGKLLTIKPTTKPQKTTRTVLDTIIFTREQAEKWMNPPFQRPLRVNAKVMALAEEIKGNGGILPGIITLGVLSNVTYLLDGQHRRQAFMISELAEGFTDIRTHYFESMADMGEEFVLLNSQLVRLRPDDILRGLEQSSAALITIRKQCPFVGYDMIRRGEKSPIVSMSAVLRCWFASAHEVPAANGHGSASAIASQFTPEDAEVIAVFLGLALKAFGRDHEYARLWGNLNLTLSMWLYRRTVLAQYSAKTPKLTRDQFAKCLMALSADSQYVDWLLGRQLRDRDRPPCFKRIKDIIARRLYEEFGKKVALPQPAWAS